MCLDCIASGGTCRTCALREAERRQGDIEKTAGRLVLSLRAVAGLAVLEAVVYALAAFGLIEAPRPDDENDIYMAWIAIPFGLTVLTSVYWFAAWMRRTQLGTAPLARHPMEYGPNAWGWFFCPVLNLWKPYQAVRELYTARSGDLVGTPLFGLWWGCWITWNVFSQMTDSFAESGGAPALEMISHAFGAAAAIFAAQVVQLVTGSQPHAR